MTNKRILTLITLLLFLLLVVGCDFIKPNQPPVITSDPVETATVGVDYTYNVVATDPNAGDVLTYSLIDEPLGMVINGTSGVITWKADDITTAGLGDYDVVVVVSDEEGLSDSQDFTITVSEFVVELVGIEVKPETVTLCIPETKGLDETFIVTADYNDGSDKVVTLDCTYGVDDISIVTIEAGKVTALKVGTATISISYTEGDITKGATLTVTVEGPITIRWLEDGKRFFPDNTVCGEPWTDNPNPSRWDGTSNVPAPEPAMLIPFYGGYYFADVNDFYNTTLDGIAGSVVIDREGQLTGDTTYIGSKGLTIKEHIEGEVEIIIGETIDWSGVDPQPAEIPEDYDGIMAGTYTQWGYAYYEGDEAEMPYDNAVLAPTLGPGWWFIAYTIYTAHGGE